MASLDKVIVTNTAALRDKYGGDFGVAVALRPLLDADRRRGLRSRLIEVNDSATMRSLGGSPVRRPTSAKQNKDAIDAIAKQLRPGYLMLLGSVDVVPHQEMRNPVPGDGDPAAPGDLPYACEAPYSQTASDFRAPTRVVGRLPDAAGASDPELLLNLIEVAARRRLRQRSNYEDYLGVSARVWQRSTALSLRNTFGSSADLKLSPAAGPRWQKPLIERRSHFINCHGAPADPHYYGQRGNDYPVAHDAALLGGKITEGTVATAECCYGAELYDSNGGQQGICLTYLANGAYGFLGSSTIAYGPAEGNGSADLICQYFLQRVLAGASLGRATLEARQAFVRNTNVLDPVDLKTLAQFSLMGDPAIHPVRRQRALPGGAKQAGPVSAAAREERRANLLANGLVLQESRSYVKPRRQTRKASRTALVELQKGLGLAGAEVSSYDVEPPPALAKLGRDEVPDLPEAMHVLVKPLESALPAREFHVVVAAERKGEVMPVRELWSR
jgi:hypothetical protein